MIGKLVRYNVDKVRKIHKTVYPEFDGCVGLVTSYTPKGSVDGKQHIAVNWVSPRPRRNYKGKEEEIFSSHFSLDRFDVIGD